MITTFSLVRVRVLVLLSLVLVLPSPGQELPSPGQERVLRLLRAPAQVPVSLLLSERVWAALPTDHNRSKKNLQKRKLL